MFLYPFIYLTSQRLYRKNIKNHSNPEKQETFHKQFKLNTSMKILLHNHLFVVLKKEESVENTYIKYQHKSQKLHIET
jgi:hypothetical protein